MYWRVPGGAHDSRHAVAVGDRNIPEALNHGIRTHVPKKNRPLVVANMRPLTMLNERAKIYSTAILVSIEDMMPQLVPLQQVGFMKKRPMMSHMARWLQRIENTHWGAERWFFGVDLEKAYGKTSHEFILARLTDLGVLLTIIRLVAKFLGGLTSILVGNAVVG